MLLAKRLGAPSQQTKSVQDVSASPLQNLRIYPDIVSIFGEKVSVEVKKTDSALRRKACVNVTHLDGSLEMVDSIEFMVDKNGSVKHKE
jgi:hypothetical protein